MVNYSKVVSDLREWASRNCKHCTYALGDHSCAYEGDQYCFNKTLLEAADAIEELDKYALTIQHEMMAEAESHIALVERLNKQIDELSKPRWISVTERLPEDFKAVLVYTPKYLNQFMAYHKDDGWRVWSPQDNHGVPFINGQGEITHWMPLPEPPKEETE